MSSAKNGKGYRGQATKLHSLLVIESRRKCEHCGKEAPENSCGHLIIRKGCEECMSRRKRNTLQCAHIVSRSYMRTRTRLDNAYCLCGGCHIYFGKWPIEFSKFVYRRTGKALYDQLKALATTKARQSKFDWRAEFDRLDKLAKDLGISHEFGFNRKKQQGDVDGEEEKGSES